MCLLLWCCSVIVLSFFTEPLIQLWLSPATDVLPQKYSNMIFTSPYDGLYVSISLVLYTSILFNMPFIVWHIYRFVAPGLLCHELKITRKVLSFGLVLGSCTVFLSYRYILPSCLDWMVQFSKMDGIYWYWSVKEYLDFFIAFIFTMSMGVSIGSVMLILLVYMPRFRLIAREYHRLILVLIFLISAIITPPDIFSQCVVAVPVALIFEAIIWLPPNNG